MATKSTPIDKPAPEYRVLNLQQVRAEKALNAPLIIAPDGSKYRLWGIPLDGFLAIYGLRTAMLSQNAGAVEDSIPLVKEKLGELLPGFDIGVLSLDEIMEVINFLMEAIGPQNAGKTGGGDDKPGE